MPAGATDVFLRNRHDTDLTATSCAEYGAGKLWSDTAIARQPWRVPGDGPAPLLSTTRFAPTWRFAMRILRMFAGRSRAVSRRMRNRTARRTEAWSACG